MSAHICIVDRFEGDDDKHKFAVVELNGEKMFNLPFELLPDNTCEGDVIKISVSIDKEATDSRKKEIELLTKNLFK